MLSSRIRRMLVISVVLASGLAAGCSVNPVTGRRQLNLIPESQEIAMGKEAAPGFVKEFDGEVPDPTLQSYVNGIGQELARVSHRPGLPYEFKLVSSKVPNAFALPGGQIFVTAGLVKLMDNERQLAAVLGHEIGHNAARHNVQGMQRSIGVSVLAEIAARATGQTLAGDAAKVIGTMANLKYSRDDEYQADELGTKYMHKAGYSPWGMVELLTILLNLHESEPGSLEELMQTHPLSSKRIAEVKALIQDKYPAYQATAPDAARGRFLNMKTRLNKVVP